ncbi:hypothetical protein BDN70DRAFT_881642, partial [Pholiota conissans]
MSFFENATGITISGEAVFNSVQGDYTLYERTTRVTNVNSYNTTNNTNVRSHNDNSRENHHAGPPATYPLEEDIDEESEELPDPLRQGPFFPPSTIPAQFMGHMATLPPGSVIDNIDAFNEKTTRNTESYRDNSRRYGVPPSEYRCARKPNVGPQADPDRQEQQNTQHAEDEPSPSEVGNHPASMVNNIISAARRRKESRRQSNKYAGHDLGNRHDMSAEVQKGFKSALGTAFNVASVPVGFPSMDSAGYDRMGQGVTPVSVDREFIDASASEEATTLEMHDQQASSFTQSFATGNQPSDFSIANTPQAFQQRPVFNTYYGNLVQHDLRHFQTNIQSGNTYNNLVMDSYNDNSVQTTFGAADRFPGTRR